MELDSVEMQVNNYSIILYCPEKINTEEIIKFLESLWNNLDANRISLNFSKIQYVFPFSTLVLAESIKEFVKIRKLNNKYTELDDSTSIIRSSTDALNYLKYFGFFQYIGLNIGNFPGFESKKSTYIPITTITNNELLANKKSKYIQDEIESRSEQLASVIFKNNNEYAQIMVAYCFREIIRNVFEHAEIDECTIMAQSWYDGDVEIAIIDRGIGIFNSLKKVHSVSSIENALHESIRPGVSSKIVENDTSKWANSGFGLYVISELCKQFGEFSLASNNKLFTIIKKDTGFKDINFSGTALKVRINISEADYFANILHNIISQGELIAQESLGRSIVASKKSKTL